MYIQQYVPANKVTRHSKCYKNREMSKNKTIFGNVHVHANNTCKYYANGNIVYLRTEYRMPGCAAQKKKLDTLFSFFTRTHFIPSLQRCCRLYFFSVLLVHSVGYMVCHGIFLPTSGVRMPKDITCMMIFLYWYVWKIHILKKVINNNVSFIFSLISYKRFVGFITQIKLLY